MLAAVETDHLARDGARLHEPPDGGAKFREVGRALQENRFGLPMEGRLVLAIIGERRGPGLCH